MNQNQQPIAPTPQPTAPQALYMAPPVATPIPKVIKPLFDLTKRDAGFVVLAGCVGIFTAAFGICQGFSLGIGLSILLAVILFGVYFAKGNKISPSTLTYGILSLGTAVVFVTTTNHSVRFAGFLTAVLLALVCFYEMVQGKTKGNKETVNALYATVAGLGNTGVAIKSLFANKKGDKKILGKVLVGIICALPVVALVLALLISSDDAFRGMMQQLFDNTFETILKCILGLCIALLMIAFGFTFRFKRTETMKSSKFSGIDTVYVLSFLSAVGVCYLLYLFSQLAYFFSAFQGFLPQGIPTYSQYARYGFFEMCIIAFINLSLVFLTLLYTKKSNGQLHPLIKGIATFIGAFTLVIIATAISKMVLYIGAYGMTVLRLTTSAFMVFTVILFVSVILRIYCSKINVIKTALVAAGCLVILMGTVNVNALCAKYNYESYKNGTLSTIDVESLYFLGEEGIPYLVELAQSDSVYCEDAMSLLANTYIYDYFDDMRHREDFSVEDLKENQKNKGFGYYSIPRQRAYDSLYQYIETHPFFPSMCSEYTRYSLSFQSIEDDFFWLF